MALTKAKASNILLTTPAASSNDVTPATTEYVTTALANMVDSAPSTLNTLNELAAALGDDANFSTTVTNSIAGKLPLAGGTMTGQILAANGTASAPSYAFSSQASTGMYKPGTSQLYFSVSGTRKLRVEASQVVVETALYANTTLGVTGAATFDSDVNVGGKVYGGTGNFTVECGNNLTLEATGGQVYFVGQSGLTGLIVSRESTSIDFHNASGNSDFKFKGSDDGSNITALTLDMSEGGAALFNKPMTVDGHTSSVASIFEGNGNGDTVPVQLKVKANDGSTSTQGLYGNAGSTSTGNTIVLGNSGTSGIMYRSAGTMYLSDPDSGNYVAQFTDQVKANAIAVGPYATFGTDYSSWQTNIGWNVRPKIGTQYTGFEAATGYHAAGASKISLAGRSMAITYWTPTAIGSSSIGSGYNVMSTDSSGVTMIGSTSSDITDNYVLRVQTQHGYGRQGSHNSSYFHHETDRSYFYWNEAGYFNGGAHTYSDESLKKNITLIPNALDSVAKMNGVSFNWKDPETRGGKETGEGKQFGVIAQNMLEVDPELPTLSVDPLAEAGNEETDDKLYSMNYDRLSPYFIEAIKELKEKLEAAEARITELEG